MADSASVVETARRIADEVLFPAALETDAADAIPARSLDTLAENGFYGLLGPAHAGGLSVGLPAFCSVVEALASGCLATTFVWIQHHSVVRAMAASPNTVLRDEWLDGLCAGSRRAGIALGGLRAGPDRLQAEPAPGGWLLSGRVPWVTGWGIVDALLAAAHAPEGQAARLMVDARESGTLTARRLRLVAANATGTVELTFRRHFVAAERGIVLEPYQAPPAHDGGGRPNGSLALGVTSRCCRLIGPSALDQELDARRRQLDDADEFAMAEARAAAAEVAYRAAGNLIAHSGSMSILAGHHALRLSREAQFLLVFGSRPAIRAALLKRLGSNR